MSGLDKHTRCFFFPKKVHTAKTVKENYDTLDGTFLTPSTIVSTFRLSFVSDTSTFISGIIFRKKIADILLNVSCGKAQNSLNVESKCYYSYGLQSLKMKSILFKFNLHYFLYPFWKNCNYFPNTLIIVTMSALKKTYCIQDIKEENCLKITSVF